MTDMTDRNIELLAIKIVDSWDMDSVLNVACEYCEECLRDGGQVEFDEAWKDYGCDD